MEKLSLLRWLDTVIQGQYLPSLSINYVTINKDLEKLPPELYLSEIDESVIEIFWDEVLMVRNTVKNRTILMFGLYL